MKDSIEQGEVLCLSSPCTPMTRQSSSTMVTSITWSGLKKLLIGTFLSDGLCQKVGHSIVACTPCIIASRCGQDSLLNHTIHAHLECKLAAELTLVPTCTPGSCAGSTVEWKKQIGRSWEGSATSSDLGTLLRHRAGGGVSANITMFKNVVMIFNIGRASVRERLS